jgi:glycosyltransferase involved in cell wall biosynthesis
LIGRLSGKKVIISIRSTKLEDKYDLIEKILEIFNISSWYILENLFHHLAAKIIVNSSGVKEAYMKNVKKCQAQKIEVIHNGFNFEKINYLDNKNKEDIRNAYGLPADKAVFICVGRIREQKNQLCLLKAAKILADQGFKDFKILFVGKKYIYYDILEKYIAKNRLSDISEFYGERKDVLSLIKASDLFILSSLWEGLANVVIESMAVGTPVLAAKIKGVEDLIAENETGFTFMVNNEKDLAEKILNIIKIDNITLGKVASQARENIRNNFSIEKLVQKTIYVYRNCLDNE